MNTPKSTTAPVLASSNGEEDFWWNGEPGKRGAIVTKTDRYGQRWVLDLESTHWVTQRVAAGLLDVTVMTINTWIRSGKVRGSKKRKVLGDISFKGDKVSVQALPSVSVIPLREIERLAEKRGIFRTAPAAPSRRRSLVAADLERKKGGDKNANKG